MSFYLAVVSPIDHPLFELSFPSSRSGPAGPSSSASGSGSGSGSGTGSALPSWTSFTTSSSSTPTPSSSASAPPPIATQAPSGVQPADLGFAPTPDTPTAHAHGLGHGHGRSGSLSFGLGGELQGAGAGAGPGAGMGERWLAQMVAHKSLDSVEEAQEGSGALYFKAVDRHNDWTVSAFLAGSVKFVLLHDIKNDDGIRLFFLDLWEAYIKVLLNPFHTVNTPIRNPLFEAKIRASAKRNL